MRSIKSKAADFEKGYQYEAAKKAARKTDIGRRSGRRGTAAWGNWCEVQ